MIRLRAVEAEETEEHGHMTGSNREYTEPTKDTVIVTVVLSIACILLAIALAGLFWWLPAI